MTSCLCYSDSQAGGFIMDTPWKKSYDPWFKDTFDYPEATLYEMVENAARLYPDYTALKFLGTEISYSRLLKEIDRTAVSLASIGFDKNQVATICLPNIPQAVIFFYAVNKLGGICNMVHPLSPAEEMLHYLRSTKSEWLIILDAMLPKQLNMLENADVKKTIVCSIMDYLKPAMKLGFYLSKGRKIKAVPEKTSIIKWKKFIQLPGDGYLSQKKRSPHECAVYLHSGGTTGAPKTIMLSADNLNILAYQGPQIVGFDMDKPFDPKNLSMVAILPLFHGFGLCMGMHTMLVNGMTAILVPQFSPDVLARVIVKNKPSFIAAVPTLFEGILKNPGLAKADLSCLKAIFCGGDTLPVDLKERFDRFVHERGGKCNLREGYGLTETVTVCAVNPEMKSRAGTVGLPLADVLMKVIEPGTTRQLPAGSDGEFCVHAPTIMLGYLDDEQATNEAVRRHEDGLNWVHTGDYGYMDEDGYFHFKQRLKRILKVSGVPVFPSQIEDVISALPDVRLVCAIGVPHPYKMQVVKAFVVPQSDNADHKKLEELIIGHCEKHLISYAIPKEIEFRDELPMTKVGKIDYVELERQEIARKSV
jgi:long-chain acyl-CoA synthetase